MLTRPFETVLTENSKGPDSVSAVLLSDVGLSLLPIEPMLQQVGRGPASVNEMGPVVDPDNHLVALSHRKPPARFELTSLGYRPSHLIR